MWRFKKARTEAVFSCVRKTSIGGNHLFRVGTASVPSQIAFHLQPARTKFPSPAHVTLIKAFVFDIPSAERNALTVCSHEKQRPKKWEEYFELLSVKDAHSRKNCRDLNGQEAWARCECDCTKRLGERLAQRGDLFLKQLRLDTCKLGRSRDAGWASMNTSRGSGPSSIKIQPLRGDEKRLA